MVSGSNGIREECMKEETKVIHPCKLYRYCVGKKHAEHRTSTVCRWMMTSYHFSLRLFMHSATYSSLSCNIFSPTYLPIIITVAWGLVPGETLKVEPSTTRRAAAPITRKSPSTTFPDAHPPW